MMRVSENRYQKDQQCLDLASLFLEHEARTQTIRAWTGLSDDRIRKLYRSYTATANRYVPRHRGKGPRQAAYFIRTNRIQQETAWLANFLLLLGAIPPEPSPNGGNALPSLSRGRALCDAFETYRAMIPSAMISFEHAIFLAKLLACGDRLQLTSCNDCGSLMVLDLLSLRDTHCHHCAGQS